MGTLASMFIAPSEGELASIIAAHFWWAADQAAYGCVSGYITTKPRFVTATTIAITGMGLEPMTSSLWGWRASLCSIPQCSFYPGNPTPGREALPLAPLFLWAIMQQVGLEPTKHYAAHLQCAPFAAWVLLHGVWRCPATVDRGGFH